MAAALSAGRVIRKVQKHEIAPVYFLNGNDDYLQDFFIEELEKVFLKDGGYKTFISLDDDNEQDLLRELSAFSLFEEKRIIVVRQIRKLTNKGKDEMLSYISSPNPSNCLLLISGEEIGKNKFLASLKQHSVHVDVTSPDGQKFREWAGYIANRKSIRINPEALDLLIDLQGDSLSKIFNEVEKLSLLLGETGVIDRSIIESTAIHQRQFN
ncbi:MAG: DNA polymerase III subunit delta, partial [FCB group bacterium]|nr:DNA polymerase III subunit delta [FCB group bacterium]